MITVKGVLYSLLSISLVSWSVLFNSGSEPSSYAVEVSTDRPVSRKYNGGRSTHRSSSLTHTTRGPVRDGGIEWVLRPLRSVFILRTPRREQEVAIRRTLLGTIST